MNIAARHIHGRGTPEAAWQAWPGLNALPEVAAHDLVPEGTRAVIVSPHPDTEILGAGGLMSQLQQVGRKMLVVKVTDGPSSARASRLASTAGSLASSSRALASAQGAMSALGLDQVPTTRIGLTEGSVSVNAIKLIEALCRQLRANDVVLTTWRFDGHPDHEATGRACAACALNVGARLVEMPIWSWHWAEPGDPRMPWPRACRLPLPAALEQRKRQAASSLTKLRHARESSPEPGENINHAESPMERVLRPYEVFFR